MVEELCLRKFSSEILHVWQIEKWKHKDLGGKMFIFLNLITHWIIIFSYLERVYLPTKRKKNLIHFVWHFIDVVKVFFQKHSRNKYDSFPFKASVKPCFDGTQLSLPGSSERSRLDSMVKPPNAHYLGTSSCGGWEPGVQNKLVYQWIPALPLINCTTLGKLLKLVVPHFPNLPKGDSKSLNFVQVSWRLIE